MIACVLASTNSIKILCAYLNNEVYSYLYIIPISIAILYYGLFSGERIGFTDKSLYTGVVLLFLSLLSLYYSARTPFIDQLVVLSLVLGVYSLVLMLTAGYRLAKSLYVIPFILLAVPLPLAFVFDLTAYLTRATSYLAIGLARVLGVSLHYTVVNGQQVVVIDTPGGKAYLSIAPVCSGIIGLTSVLGVSPVIAFLAYRARVDRVLKKIAILVIGLLVLTVLMFIANVLRLALVFATTSWFGLGIGYGLFHYTPEIVFIPPIAYVVIKVIEKIGNGIDLSLQKPVISISGDKLVLYTSVCFVIASIAPLIIIGSTLTINTPEQYFINTYSGPPRLIDKRAVVVEDLFSEYNRSFIVRYIGRNPEWEELLGATTRVHEYVFIDYSSGVEFHVFIEFSQVATHIHVWELCLKWQGITNFTAGAITFVSPDNEYIADVREINFTHGLTHGYIIYWRDNVYTENGLEFFRYSIVVTNTTYPVSPYYMDIARDIARNTWMKLLNTSYIVYSVETINESVLLYTLLYYIVAVMVYGAIGSNKLLVVKKYLFRKKH